jgi:hypothetical protein
VSLRNFLTELLKGQNFTIAKELPDMTFSPFRIEKNVTIFQVLDELASKFFLTCYLRGDKIFVGLPYTEFISTPADKGNGRYAILDFQRNIRNEANLKFENAQQKKIGAKVISILPNGKRLEVQVGDTTGDQRTLYTRNITDLNELKKWGERELSQFKVDGYSGKIVTFGRPYVIHGATVRIKNNRYPERAGSYLVDSVITEWGINGFMRDLELGKRI